MRGADLVVVSPGVPLDSPQIAPARAAGVPVVGELELGWRAMDAETVAITGTNGKTTTTSLTGRRCSARARVRCSSPGTSARRWPRTRSRSRRTASPSCEVSSFQLETIEAFHPRVAAVLNVTPDHLDRHGSLDAYAGAKARIFMNQAARTAPCSTRTTRVRSALASRTRARVLWFSRRSPSTAACASATAGSWRALRRRRGALCPWPRSRCAASTTSRTCSRPPRAPAGWAWRPTPSARGIAAFQAVPHRIEPVRTLDGVAFFNDSKGTNVDSTIKAIESFAEPIVLIAGGVGKGQDFRPLAEAARGRVARAVVLGQDGGKIGAALAAVGVPVTSAASFDEAVALARAAAAPGAGRAAVAGVRVVRHVPELRAPRRRLPRARAGARLMPRKMRPDMWLFGVVVALLSAGIVMVYSASAIVAARPLPRSVLLPQEAGCSGRVLGCRAPVARAARRLPPAREARARRCSAGRRAARARADPAVRRSPINGTRRWLRLGPLSFQPAELAKLALVVYLAAFLARNARAARATSGAGLLPPLSVAGAAGRARARPARPRQVPDAARRDRSGCCSSAAAALQQLAVIVVAALPALAAWPCGWRPTGCGGSSPSSIRGATRGAAASRSSSRGWRSAAAGSSGGASASRKQKLFYLPEAHTDFIFADHRRGAGLRRRAGDRRRSSRCSSGAACASASARADPFGAYLALGITVLVATQTLVNLGVVTGLLPTKGLPLPFISFGGSALLVTMLRPRACC